MSVVVPQRRRLLCSFEIVGAVGASEGHVEMSVNIDSAGQNIFSGGIDNFSGIVARKILTDRRDLATADRNVACVRICGRGHASVL